MTQIFFRTRAILYLTLLLISTFTTFENSSRRTARRFARVAATVASHQSLSDLGRDPLEAAEEAFARFGVFPISFAISGTRLRWRDDPRTLNKSKALSVIVPGAISAAGSAATHKFLAESAYMGEYASSWLAHTWRKGGWDCMRHLEIIASGALPVYRDAQLIPPFVMTLYPKYLFEDIEHVVSVGIGDVKSYESLRSKLLVWTARHLTTETLVNYMMGCAKLDAASVKRILFIDPLLSVQPDYLSVAVYIEAPYLYDSDGCRESAHLLYGRGFNYACTLPSSARQPPLDQEFVTASIRSRAYDVVVFGAVQRGTDLVEEALAAYSGCTRCVWLCHGKDNLDDLWYERYYNRSLVFIRELNSHFIESELASRRGAREKS